MSAGPNEKEAKKVTQLTEQHVRKLVDCVLE